MRQRASKWLVRNLRAQIIEVVRDRLLRADEQQITDIRLPRLHVRIDSADRRVNRPNGLSVDVVRLQPLEKNAVTVHSRRRRAIKLLSEEAGDSCAIWIRRLRENDVVPIVHR